MKPKLAVLIPMALCALAVFGSRQSGPSITVLSSSMGEVGYNSSQHQVGTTFKLSVSLPSTATGSTTGGTTNDIQTSGTVGTTSTGLSSGTTSTGTTSTSSTGTSSTTGGGPTYAAYYAVAKTGTGYNTDWSCSGTVAYNESVPLGPTNLHLGYCGASGPYISNNSTVGLTDNTPATGDKVTTWRIVVETFYVNGLPTSYNHWYWRTDYKLTKIALIASAIDSRKINGQPDLDGETPGDANADPKNMSFNGWTFNGGLFVGNAPWTTGDQSGTSRVQLSAASFPTFISPAAACVGIVPLAQPPSTFNTSFGIGLFPAASNDPNLNQNQSTVTWSTGWNLPSGQPTQSVSVGGTQGFFFDYLNLPCAVQNDQILAVTNEAQFISSGSPGWIYFASAPYNSPDGQPRMWVMDAVYTNYWTTTGDQNP